MNTHYLIVLVDQVTSDFLSKALLLSDHTLASEALVRIKDHLKLIRHISPAGVRYFRGGDRSWYETAGYQVVFCASPVFSFEISLPKLSYDLLQFSAIASGCSVGDEASLRFKDSLQLFKRVGGSGERQWRDSLSSSDKNDLPVEIVLSTLPPFSL